MLESDLSVELIAAFFSSISNDARIGPAHISLFMAIMQHWQTSNYQNPFRVFGKDLMKTAKISGTATYHKSIRELNKYGYINYKPSYNHFKGSLICIKTNNK